MQRGFVGAREAFSVQKHPFVGVRKAFSVQKHPFVGVRKVFSVQKHPFVGVREAFSGQNLPFVGVREAFSGQKLPFVELQSLLSMREPLFFAVGIQAGMLRQKISAVLWRVSLRSSMPDACIDYRGQNLKMLMNETRRNLTVSFTYRFGGYVEKKHKGVDSSRFGH